MPSRPGTWSPGPQKPVDFKASQVVDMHIDLLKIVIFHSFLYVYQRVHDHVCICRYIYICIYTLFPLCIVYMFMYVCGFCKSHAVMHIYIYTYACVYIRYTYI